MDTRLVPGGLTTRVAYGNKGKEYGYFMEMLTKKGGVVYSAGPFHDEEIAVIYQRAVSDQDNINNFYWDYLDMLAEMLQASDYVGGYRSSETYNKYYANDGWGEVKFLTYGDYYGDGIIGESNTECAFEELSKEFPDDVGKKYRDYGSVAVVVNVLNAELMDKIYDLKQQYDDYIVLYDNDYERRENAAKQAYFLENVYPELQKYSIDNEIDVFTVVVLDQNGEPEVRFLDNPTVKWTLYSTASEFINEDGTAGMYMRDEYIPEIITKALHDDVEYWGSRLVKLRQRIDKLRLWLAASRHYQLAMFNDLTSGYYNPAIHQALRIQTADGRVHLTWVHKDYMPD